MKCLLAILIVLSAQAEELDFFDMQQKAIFRQSISHYVNSWDRWCDVVGADCRKLPCEQAFVMPYFSASSDCVRHEHEEFLDTFSTGGLPDDLPRLDKWSNPFRVEVCDRPDGSLSLLVRSRGADGVIDTPSRVPAQLEPNSFKGDLAYVDGCVLWDRIASGRK